MYIVAVANFQCFHSETSQQTYCNMVVYRIDPSKFTRAQLLEQFANTMGVLRALERKGMSRRHCMYLETFFWHHVPFYIQCYLRYLAKVAFRHIRLRIASEVWNPDYVWKTGTKRGATTMQVMQRLWDQHTKEHNDGNDISSNLDSYVI